MLTDINRKLDIVMIYAVQGDDISLDEAEKFMTEEDAATHIDEIVAEGYDRDYYYYITQLQACIRSKDDENRLKINENPYRT